MGNPFAIQRNTDGAIKKLPLGAVLSNMMTFWAQWWNNPFCFSATVQWIVNTFRVRKKQSVAWPAQKVVIFNYLVGHSCVDVSMKLRQFGIPSQTLGLSIELWPDRKGIGIRKRFLVPKSQAAMADDILRGHFAESITVESGKVGSGGTFNQPWGVWAKPRSWDEALTVAIYGFLEKAATRAVKASYDATKKEKQPAKSPMQKMQAVDKPRLAKSATKARERKTARKPVGKRIINTIWRA